MVFSHSKGEVYKTFSQMRFGGMPESSTNLGLVCGGVKMLHFSTCSQIEHPEAYMHEKERGESPLSVH